jgi:hypothetical protein
MVWKRNPALAALSFQSGRSSQVMRCMIYPPADTRKEPLCAVPPNPPRVVPDGLTAGVEARALFVNAAEAARPVWDEPALVDDPQLGNR